MWMVLYHCPAPLTSKNCKLLQAYVVSLFCNSFWLMGSLILWWLQSKGQEVILILGQLELKWGYFLFLWHWEELLACFCKTLIFNSLVRYLETGTATNYNSFWFVEQKISNKCVHCHEIRSGWRAWFLGYKYICGWTGEHRQVEEIHPCPVSFFDCFCS